MEFKVGEELRYIGCSHEHYTKGAVYEVSSIEEDEGETWVGINDNEGMYTGWKPVDVPEFFERIDEPQFKVGDKVRHTGMSDTYYKQDGIYEVIEVDETEVRISNEIGNTTWFTLSQVVSLFKHIDEQQPQVTEEQTAEEKVLAAWFNYDDSEVTNESYETGFDDGLRHGIKVVLGAYGITVKGIND